MAYFGEVVGILSYTLYEPSSPVPKCAALYCVCPSFWRIIKLGTGPHLPVADETSLLEKQETIATECGLLRRAPAVHRDLKTTKPPLKVHSSTCL